MFSCPETSPFPWWGCFGKHHQGKSTFLLSSLTNGFQEKKKKRLLCKAEALEGKCLLKRVCIRSGKSRLPQWALQAQAELWCHQADSLVVVQLASWPFCNCGMLWGGSASYLVKTIMLFLSHCFHTPWHNGVTDAICRESLSLHLLHCSSFLGFL